MQPNRDQLLRRSTRLSGAGVSLKSRKHEGTVIILNMLLTVTVIYYFKIGRRLTQTHKKALWLQCLDIPTHATSSHMDTCEGTLRHHI